MRTNDNIQKTPTGQGDEFAGLQFFNKYYKMIAIDLSKQKALNADAKAIKELILLEIQDKMKVQKCFLILKKQNKPFQIFDKKLRKYCKCVL